MQNNWYIAYVNGDDKLLFSRINFIKKVEYASNKGRFQPSSVKDQLDFLKNIQNAMTLYGKPKKIATIKANKIIAKYFDDDVKVQLSSQKIINKLPDGSIIFTLEYTQPKEILPLIQSWMPNLTILEPDDLKEIYIKNLQRTIQNMQ
jgi:predicted DNA-binding transcriptional regulator YafY